ncbi:histidine kinase [Pelagibacterium halotolerans]|uniref:histidine kinase n=1 Tax=Pelagibacterium halotolerans TaxID=531813 RepID=UPI0038510EB3
MPTLFRLLILTAFIVGLAYAGMFALMVFVEPREKEVVVRVPTSALLAESNRQ